MASTLEDLIFSPNGVQQPQTAGAGDWWSANAPPQTSNAPMGSSSGLQGQAAMDAFGRAWTSSGGRTVADLKAFADNWNAQNPSSPVTLGGSKGDKVYGPGGQFWADAVLAAGAGGQGASWQTASGSGGGGGLLDPIHLPSVEELQAMPGYQAAIDAAVKNVQGSAAARGVLRTGGAVRAAQNAAENTAMQKYADIAGLSLGVQQRNQDSPFQKLSTLAQLGLNATGQTGDAGSAYGSGGTDAIYGAGNAQSAGAVARGNTLSDLIGVGTNLAGNVYNATRKPSPLIYGPNQP